MSDYIDNQLRESGDVPEVENEEGEEEEEEEGEEEYMAEQNEGSSLMGIM